MDIQRVIATLPSRLATRLARRAAMRQIAGREIAAVVIAAAAVRPQSVAAQDDTGGQCCAEACAPAAESMRLLEVPVARCEPCPAYPA